MWNSLICIVSLMVFSPLKAGKLVVKEEKFELPKIEGFAVQHIMYSKDYKTLALFDPEKKMIYFQDMETGSLYSWDYGALGYERIHIADFSPDGKEVIYMYSTQKFGKWEKKLAIYNIKEGKTRTLLSFEKLIGGPPRWSPDGKWIVLSGTLKSGGGTYLWLVRSDGSEVEKIGDFGVFKLKWSNTGKYIAYTRIEKGSAKLWLYDMEKKQHIYLAQGGEGDKVFSPDDRYIAYAPGDGVVSVDGKKRIKIPHIWWPIRWSPNGKRLAFLREKIDPTKGTIQELNLYIVNADGKDYRKLGKVPVDLKFFKWVNDTTIVFQRNPQIAGRG